MDAAVLAAVSAEADKARRERADWQAQRWQLEQQAAHRVREADALREACCRLEEAALAMRQGGCQSAVEGRQAQVEQPPEMRQTQTHSATQTSEAVGEPAAPGSSREGASLSSQRSCASSSSGAVSSADSIHSMRPVTAVQLRLELAKLGTTTHKPITPLPATACSRPWTASLLQRGAPAAQPCLLDEQRAGYPALGRPCGGSSESSWSSLGPGSVSTSDGGGSIEGAAASSGAPDAEAEEEEETFATPQCSPRSASALEADEDACPCSDDLPTTCQTSCTSERSWRSGAVPILDLASLLDAPGL